MSQGPVSLKSQELFWPEKPIVELQSTCFEKLIFEHVFNARKTKRIAKFDSLEPRRCEGIKGIVAPEIGPKSFGTSPGPRFLHGGKPWTVIGVRFKILDIFNRQNNV